MRSFLDFYQHLPEHLNPTTFQVGFLAVGWYSLMYLTAFVTVYLLLRYRRKKGEGNYSCDLVIDFLFYAILGVLVGGRLGYVFFYNPSFYLANPLAVISPFDLAGNFVGIYGMSYHGGLAGVILASLVFVRKNKLDFWRFADFVIPAVPAGYFFGRMGNFLNGELYGRLTDSALGMYFPTDPLGLLRHPSQLYEAFFEGLVLFVALWILRNKSRFPGFLLAVYLFGYGLFRFIIEFFREPDAQIGLIFNLFTLGQVFLLGMIAISLMIFLMNIRKPS